MTKNFRITTKTKPNLEDNTQVFDENVHISGNLVVDGTSPGGGSSTWTEIDESTLSTTSSVWISSSLSVNSGISGSHTKLSDGTDAFLAGDNITINFNTAGAVEITGSDDAVTSVFGRTDAVTAQASDYDASQIDNDSSVAGTFVDDALNTLNTDKIEATGLSASLSASLITNDSTVSGDFVDNALDTLSSSVNQLILTKADRATDLTASVIVNDSSVAGTFVDDALNNLNTDKIEATDLSASLSASLISNDSTVNGFFVDNALDSLEANKLEFNADGGGFFATNNAIARFTSDDSSFLYDSGILIDDNDDITEVRNLTVGKSGVGGQGDLTVKRDLSVTGISDFDGNAYFASGANMSGSVEVAGNVNVDGYITGTLANGTQYNGVSQVISSNGILGLTTSLGPNFEWVINENTTIVEPNNSGLPGESITLTAYQSTGSHIITFDSGSWEPAGQITELATNSGSYSIISATAREDIHGNIKWLYAISHNEGVDNVFDVDATGSTTGSNALTIAQAVISENEMAGFLDFNVVAKATASGDNAHFGVRSLFYRVSNATTNTHEDIYSSFSTNGEWAVTHSFDGNVINVDVVGSGSQNVDWRIKGIFKTV